MSLRIFMKNLLRERERKKIEANASKTNSLKVNMTDNKNLDLLKI